jgi:hypothetical protein
MKDMLTCLKEEKKPLYRKFFTLPDKEFIMTEEVKVQFNSNILNLENLDELEYTDITISYLKQVMGFITDLKSKGMDIDDKKYLSWMNTELDKIGLSGLIKGAYVSEVQPPVKETVVRHEKAPTNSLNTQLPDESPLSDLDIPTDSDQSSS